LILTELEEARDSDFIEILEDFDDIKSIKFFSDKLGLFNYKRGLSRDQMNMGLMFPYRMRVTVVPQNINHTQHINVNKNSPESESHNMSSRDSSISCGLYLMKWWPQI
jgi:hypothetical protein